MRVHWRPFLLNPHLPPEGMDRATYVRRKFGGDARRVYQRIEDGGRADGVEFAFERMPRTPNTTLAHRLILFADEQGRADGVIRALFRALFQDGRDVGRPRCSRPLPQRPGSTAIEVSAFLAGDRLQARGDRGPPAGRPRRRPGRAGVHRRARARHHRRPAAEILADLLDVAVAARRMPAPS